MADVVEEIRRVCSVREAVDVDVEESVACFATNEAVHKEESDVDEAAGVSERLAESE